MPGTITAFKLLFHSPNPMDRAICVAIPSRTTSRAKSSNRLEGSFVIGIR